MKLLGDNGQSLAISVRIFRTDIADVVKLCFPYGNRGDLTLYIDPSELQPMVCFSTEGTEKHKLFTMSTLSSAEVSASLRDVGVEIVQALECGLLAAPLLRLLQIGAVRPQLLQTLFWAMPKEEREELARLALNEDSNLRIIQNAFPESFWLQAAFPTLVEWRGNRQKARSQSLLSAASEETALLPAMGEAALEPGIVIQSLARRTVLPRRNACIVATARDEGPYLLDWISYHLSIGFDHIFLYTNDNSDGSDVLLERLAQHGAITLIKNQRGSAVGPQLKAYTHALTALPATLDYRWTAVLDLDEYVGFDLRKFETITDFISWQDCRPVDAIALCWLIYCASPVDRWSPISSLNRFPRRGAVINHHVKSLFRTRLFWHTQPHFPTATLDEAFHYRTESGAIHHHPGVTERLAAFSETPSADYAWVNHYLLRTADEALWKLRRGRADWLQADAAKLGSEFQDFVCEAFISLSRPEDQVDDRRTIACARNQPRELARLLALPGVAEIDAQIKAEFGRLLSENTTAFLDRPLPPDAPDSLKQFRELIHYSRLQC